MKQPQRKQKGRQANWLTWVLVVLGVALIGTLIWITQTRPPAENQSSATCTGSRAATK
ncbi:MAG: hypothetical protein WCC10_03830 [Tumebacillaceae bacterium]